jgi:hypothetical protein
MIESGGFPGVINTGLPARYDWAGNVNDLISALAAAMLQFAFRTEEIAT